jgi:hypothetical protein
MTYEKNSILHCLNQAFAEFSVHVKIKYSAPPDAGPTDFNSGAPFSNNNEGQVEIIPTPAPVDVCTLAKLEKKSPPIQKKELITIQKIATSDIITATFTDKNASKKLPAILATMADLIDREYQDKISSDCKKILDRYSITDRPFISHIPFYKLMGLNGTGFKIFNICNMSPPQTNEKPSIIISIVDLPILFANNGSNIKIKPIFDAMPKSEENINQRSYERLRNESGIQEFMNSFLYSSANNSGRQTRGDGFRARHSMMLVNPDPSFCQVLSTDDEVSKNTCYIPSAITNSGGHFNLLGRADPEKDIDFLFFSYNTLPTELKITSDKRIDLTEPLELALREIVIAYLSPYKEKHDISEAIKTVNGHLDRLKLSNFFSESTRVRLFELDNDVFFYAKNPRDNIRRYKPEKYPLPPFPSSDYKYVRRLLTDNAPYMARQKRKNLTDDQHSFKLKLFMGKRKSVKLGEVIKKDLNPFWSTISGSAENVVALAFSDENVDAKHFYQQYLKECSPFHPPKIPNPFSEEKMTVTAPRADQEWCHLIAHKDSNGDNTAGNLVAGSFHANTEQCAIESAIRGSAHYDNIKLKITAYLIPSNPEYSFLPSGPLDKVLRSTEIKSLISQGNSLDEPNWLTPARLYMLIATGTPLKSGSPDAQNTLIDTIISISPAFGINNLTSKILREYYGFSEIGMEEEDTRDTQGSETQKLRNVLRHLYDKLYNVYYKTLPVAAFIRYRIFVNRIKEVDYVVDAMRDEFDINEYRLTRWKISSLLNNNKSETKHDCDYDFNSGAEPDSPAASLNTAATKVLSQKNDNTKNVLKRDFYYDFSSNSVVLQTIGIKSRRKLSQFDEADSKQEKIEKSVERREEYSPLPRPEIRKPSVSRRHSPGRVQFRKDSREWSDDSRISTDNS